MSMVTEIVMYRRMLHCGLLMIPSSGVDCLVTVQETKCQSESDVVEAWCQVQVAVTSLRMMLMSPR
jgi:hypothetical protein